MNLIPFGDVDRERVEISKKYRLIEMVNGIWRLTTKCKDNYQSESYVKYLRGTVEKPERISSQLPLIQKTVPKLTPQQEVRSPEYQRALDDIFKL